MENTTEELKRAQAQRFLALKNAFRTLDAFVIPSLDPEMMENYDQIKQYLNKNYRGDMIDEDVEPYTSERA